MKDDVISRQAAIDALDKHLQTTDVPVSYPGIISALTEWLNEVPSAQPQRTGRWIDRNDNVATCSVCGKRWGLYRLLNYCPNCGERMDDGE